MNTVLSNQDILRLYGKEVFIYPFNINSLDGGATYNLSASRFAFYIDYESNGIKHYVYAVNCNNDIIIPPDKTVLIQTDECIYVSKKICGTYHSKVGLVSKGLSHISTTLDPEYFGTSLIAIHNNSKIDQSIHVGDTFVSLMLYRLSSPANPRHDNIAGRYDILSGEADGLTFGKCGNNEVVELFKKNLKEWREQKYRSSKNILKEMCYDERRKLLLPKRKTTIACVSGLMSILFALVPSLAMVLYWFLGEKLTIVKEVLAGEYNSSIIIALCGTIMFLKDKILGLIEMYYIKNDNKN